MPTIAEQIADWLVQHGIEQIFAVTGGGAMFLNQALGSHPQLRCTFMHHEQACAMAAEGYARIAGKPAVVMLTTGPGAINALNGVYGAYTDSIPMLVLSGQVKRATCVDFYEDCDVRQLGDQEGPTIAMAAPICTFAQLVQRATELATLLPRALQQATAGRGGPAWLDIPLDIQQSRQAIHIPPMQPAAAPSAEHTSRLRQHCRTLIQRLQQAQRPLILAGTGVRLSGSEKRLLALVERLGIPLATAWTHDVIASDHPLFAGRPGTIGTRAGNFCLQAADWLLVLGSRLNIRQTSYHWQDFAPHAWQAQVDIDAAELDKPTHQPHLGIAADLGHFLAVLEEELTALPHSQSWQPWVQWCQNIGQRYSAAREHGLLPTPLPPSGGGAGGEGAREARCAYGSLAGERQAQHINPYHAIHHIFSQLRASDIIACGNASACILPFQIGHLQAGQRMFSNSGSASMGYDLPAAIGAAIAAQGKQRVVCFAGDGSLQMNVQELQTLKTTGLSVIVIVINNGGYQSIRQTHSNFFGRVIGATPDSGVEFPDYCQLARAYGLPAERITSHADLTRLAALLHENGPLLIDLHVDPQQGFAPRIQSRMDSHGQFLTPALDDMYPFLPPEEVQTVRQSALDI